MLKNLTRFSVILSLSACLLSCTETTEDESVFFVTPETPAWLMENSGSLEVGIGFTQNSPAFVQVAFNISDPARLALIAGSYGNAITFMPNQTAKFTPLTFACIDNAVQDQDAIVTINFSTISSDPAFHGLSQSVVVYCMNDDTGVPSNPNPDTPVNPNPDTPVNPNPDTPVNPNPDTPQVASVHITPTSLTTYESGTTASFQVSLGSAPTAQVIIPVRSSDTSEGTLNAASLSFDATNWNIPQSVTITGVDDFDIDGNITYDIDFGPVQSLDPAYHDIDIQSIKVTNIDNDASADASMYISADTLRIFEGGSTTFYIAPGIQPTSAVTVNLSVTDPSEGTLSSTMLTFSTSNWDTRQAVTLTGLRDGQSDGDQDYLLELIITSADPRFNQLYTAPISVKTVDTEGTPDSNSVTFRAVAANITSGDHQSYSPGHGIRIFQAVKPDIVMIQEFNMYSSSGGDSVANIRKLVDQAFGSNYNYHRGRGQIPNGIITHYNIIDSGYWKSNKQSNRDWDWSIIDLPGPKELLVISVHLGTDTNTQEVPSLMQAINKKRTADKQKKLEYFLMIGGDFNRNYHQKGSLSDYFAVNVALPKDQEGEEATNAKRKTVLDHLFVDKDFQRYEIPCTIGRHTYKNGHVFDSRVYRDNGELGDVSPVQANDSGAVNMQHMAVIRDFTYTYD